MILFKTLRWKNLLSTGNIFTEINLNVHKSTLIVGTNGAGKSTVLDALSFVLFGKPFRKINKPQLLNTVTQKNLVVEVLFTIGSNDYKIIRGLKPAIFEVYQNNKLLNQSTEIKDYQEVLEKQILKVNHKSFCQVVVLGSATYQPFMQLPTGQRREIIEDILDLQIFSTMNSLLKDKIQKNNDEVNEANYNKKLIDEKIKLIKEHLKEIQNNNEVIIEEKTNQRNHLIEQNIHNTLYLTTLNSNISDVENKTSDSASLNKKINDINAIKYTLDAKTDFVKKDIKFFENHTDCPTCKQEIDKTFQCETIILKNLEIKKFNDAISELTVKLNNLLIKRDKVEKLKLDLTNLNLDKHRLLTKIANTDEYVNSLDNEINTIKIKEKTYDVSKITELEAQYEIIKIKLNELIAEKNILLMSGSLLKDGGIKSKIVKQYIPVINKLINKYLEALNFMCQFELDESFNETIKSRFRDEFSFASFSEGEKMRINLAVLFTWRTIAKMRNSINTNVLIMDEVFDSSLDLNGTDDFLKIINELTLGSNVIIISHKKDQLSDKFDDIIKFEKYKNFSRISVNKD